MFCLPAEPAAEICNILHVPVTTNTRVEFREVDSSFVVEIHRNGEADKILGVDPVRVKLEFGGRTIITPGIDGEHETRILPKRGVLPTPFFLDLFPESAKVLRNHAMVGAVFEIIERHMPLPPIDLPSKRMPPGSAAQSNFGE